MHAVDTGQCLLVKGWKGSSWSFPHGKKSKDEEDHACAIREVMEETGFDVSKLLNKDEYLEVIFGQQRVRFYIIAGVKDDTAFAPLTKKEISDGAENGYGAKATEILDQVRGRSVISYG
ncbi:mRNA-decapping enzyme subunit 2 [Glycine max]|nr:mRNA-decapping enzyme subunit 2 [Glycine max]